MLKWYFLTELKTAKCRPQIGIWALLDMLYPNPTGSFNIFLLFLLTFFFCLSKIVALISSCVSQVCYGKGPTAKSKIMVFGCCEFV